MRRLAVFDLDGTILAGNSLHLFLKWMYFRMGERGCGVVVWAAILRSMGVLTHMEFKRRSLYALQGRPAKEIGRVGEEFVKTAGRLALRQAALEEILRCRQMGFQPFLATAAPDVYVAEFAAKLGMDGYVATRLAFDKDGKFMGRLCGPNCTGGEKVRRVREAFPGEESVLERAYSDHEDDVELLRAAERAFVVNPSPTLSGLARAEKWEQIRW